MLALPTTIDVEARRYIAVRLPVTIPFGDEMDPAFDELFAALRVQELNQTAWSSSSST